MHSSRSRLHCLGRSHTTSRAQRRAYSSSPRPSEPAGPSRHAQFYSDLVPGMIPVALLGSAVYLGLRLVQGSLSHERYLERAEERVKELEDEIDALRRSGVLVHDGVDAQVESTTRARWWPW